jgi:DNA polymerase-1
VDTQPLVVFDGTAMLFRSYYGMSSFTSAEGIEVGGVFGVALQLASFIRRVRSRRFFIVFDAGRKTFRNEIDPSYKANRGPPPDDLVPQFGMVQEMVEALGFLHLSMPGFEADDLMATAAAECRRAAVDCWLVSPDKDLYQLVDEHVRIYHPKRKTVLGADFVLETLGVQPSAAVDYFALVGDNVDNIPGVRGIGPKAAAQLLRHFPSLDEIYERLDEVPALPIRGARSLAAKLGSSRSDAYLARSLVRLRDDVQLELGGPLLEKAQWHGPFQEADTFFERLGFDRPLRELRAVVATP